MTRLLVSVRNVEEARSAWEGGADLIDVKEPTKGALGKANDETIAAICRFAAGRVPVSVALGEIDQVELSSSFPRTGVSFAKWGLSGSIGSDWQKASQAVADKLGHIKPVPVAYADHERARAPVPRDICDFVCQMSWPVFLLDTWAKDGSRLIDWITLESLHELIQICQASQVQVALAGSLTLPDLDGVLPLQPNWIAVRGAACVGGRDGQISAENVSILQQRITKLSRAG